MDSLLHQPAMYIDHMCNCVSATNQNWAQCFVSVDIVRLWILLCASGNVSVVVSILYSNAEVSHGILVINICKDWPLNSYERYIAGTDCVMLDHLCRGTCHPSSKRAG